MCVCVCGLQAAGTEEEGKEGASSGAEDLPVNGLTDGDHISFSYSSDEDFLPHHMTSPTGEGKPSKKPYNGWPAQDLTSDLELEREKRRAADSLSLDQRRRRLCSITPRTPVTTPTLTTPSSSTGNSESSRQPVSPGLQLRNSLSPSQKSPLSSLSGSESLQPSRRKTHSPIPHSRKTHSPVPHSRKTHSPVPQSPDQSGMESSSDGSSETWQPAGGSVQKRQKKEHHKTEGERERGRKERKKPRPPDVGRVEAGKRSVKRELSESSDEDKRALEQLKRKVEEQELTERGKMTSHDVTERKSHEVMEGKSLEEELEMSSSSESEGSGEELGMGTKARSKRQLLSSSDSESDSPASRHQQSGRGLEIGCGLPKQRPPKTAPLSPEKLVRKRSPVEVVSPAKKLRLVDIDFTGGRMRLAPPKPRPSPSKPRPHSERSGAGPHSERSGAGPHRKLTPVHANASNILKSKPLPRPHLPIKRAPHEKRPPCSKDAVLAAKFPQKRKLLDTPPNRAHKPSKLKHSFRHL